VNVLFAVSECVPFAKTGGLADVAGSLPYELNKLGVRVSVILPKYSTISKDYQNELQFVSSFSISMGWRQQHVGIEKLIIDGVTYFFIDNEYYFKRDNLYGYYDDGERFSYFCHAVIEAILRLSIQVDIIHCHDWHTAMIPLLLKEKQQDRIKTLFTIHNLHFQGLFPKEIVADLLNIGDSYFSPNLLEFHGLVNLMKGGIISSDYVTTVSPTYCYEIQTPFFGERLDGLLRSQSDRLYGILNGIDYKKYDPSRDHLIPYHYDVNSIEKKQHNKRILQSHFRLMEDPTIPIVTMVTRLTKQKGLELVTHVFHEIIQQNVQFIVLGSGDSDFEQFFKEMTLMYPNKVRSFIGFDEKLAHLLYAGADLFLMPSKFEPCGLGQLIAMRYGTIPIVRETGGLNDTVTSYNELEQSGNGFSFANFNAHDMLYTINRSLYFYQNKESWQRIVQNAMSEDFSWEQSAFVYYQLYSKLCSPVRSERNVLKQGSV
jgi:starch synthase